MAEWRSKLGLWLGFVLIAAAAAAAPAAAQQDFRSLLVEVPHPDLSREEEAVQTQLERARAALDGLLANPETPRDILAEAFGHLGKLYLLYDLHFVAPPTLRNATALAPDDPRWHYYLAVHQFYEGELEETESELRKVLELVPEDVPTKIRLADVLVERGQNEEARSLYEEVLEERPESAAVFAGLGRIALDAGEPEKAIELLNRALELQPEADALYHPLGMAYRALGDREQAREAMKKNKHGRVLFRDALMEELAVSNLSAEARFQAASDALRRGDMEEAATLLREFVKIKPDDAVAWHNLGVALLASGHPEEGQRMLRRSIEIDPDYRAGHFSLGSALADDGRFEEAVGHYRRAHELDPEEPTIHADWATLLAKVGRTDEALSELSALAESSDDLYPKLKYATVLASAGKAEAEPLLRELADSPALERTYRAEAQYHLAVIELERGDRAAASQLVESALELDPKSSEINALRGRMLGQEGAFAEAAEHFDRAVASAPWDEQLHLSRAMALILEEDYVEARIALEESVVQLPDSLTLNHLLARLLATAPDERVRDADKAVRLAEQVVQRRLTIDFAETLSMALAEAGRFEDAIDMQLRVLEQVELHDGRDSEAYRRSAERLERYRASQPIRAPWFES